MNKAMGWVRDHLLGPVVAGLVLLVGGYIASPWIAERIEDPSCDDPKELKPLEGIKARGQAREGDEFERKGPVDYQADNLVDGDSSTAWVEGAKDLGLGSEVSLSLGHGNPDVRLVCLVNGYAESWDLYQRNSRVRLLTVETDAGDRSALLGDLGTSQHPAVHQEVNVAEGKTSRICLTIESAYAAQLPRAGSTRYADTSISEIEVWVAR